MENYILNRKILEIEKNKEYSIRIPTMFHASSCQFIVEVPADQLYEDLYIELAIRNPLEPSEGNLKLVRVPILNILTRFSPHEVQGLEARDYLLFACKSNHTVSVALSIVI